MSIRDFIDGFLETWGNPTLLDIAIGAGIAIVATPLIIFGAALLSSL